jgi:glycosyltransferase involved in cell wall biosynthesis
MRILLITPIRFWGGGEHFLVALGRGLVERGHEVFLVAPPGSAVAAGGEEAGLAVIPVALRGELDPRTLLRLNGILRRRRPQAALANMDKAVRMLALARGRLRLPIVRRLGMSTPFPDAWRFRHTYRKVAARLVVNARGTAEVLARENPWLPSGRVVVIPGAIDLAALDRVDRSVARRELRALAGGEHEGSGAVVAAVGRLVHQKRPEVLVRALAALGAAAPAAIWIGEGDKRGEIAALAASLGVKLHLAGFRADAPRLLAGADLLVQASEAEGMPHAVLEAMALRVPVVATRISGVVELLEEGRGLMVPVGDPAALAGAVRETLGDPEGARVRAERARALVEGEHTREIMLERYERLFEDVVEGAGG